MTDSPMSHDPLPEGALARILMYGTQEDDGDGIDLQVTSTALRIAPGPADEQHPAWPPGFLRDFADRIEEGSLIAYNHDDEPEG